MIRAILRPFRRLMLWLTDQNQLHDRLGHLERLLHDAAARQEAAARRQEVAAVLLSPPAEAQAELRARLDTLLAREDVATARARQLAGTIDRLLGHLVRQEAMVGEARQAIAAAGEGVRLRLEQLLARDDAAATRAYSVSEKLDLALGHLDRQDAASALSRLDALLAREDAATARAYGVNEKLDRALGLLVGNDTEISLLYGLSEKLDLVIGHLAPLLARIDQVGSEQMPAEIDRLDGYLCHHVSAIRADLARLDAALGRDARPV